MRTLAWALFRVASVAFVGVALQSGTAQISNSRVNGLPSNLSKRIDPAKEARSEDISRILRRARLIGVVCGEDVNPQSCRFFANSLKMDLADQPVQVSLFSQPETLVQSFYVPPMLIPFTDVTLRLIEDGPPNQTRLYVGGFCFDSQAQDENGFQLPRWVQLEGGSEAGPLETDRAVAAKQLARTFSSYWHTRIVAQKTPVQFVQTPSTASKRLDAYQQVCKIAGGCQNVKVTLAPLDIPGPGPAIIGVTVETAHVAGTSVYIADETGYTVSTSEGSGGREIAHVKTKREAENIAVNIAVVAWLAEYHHTGEVDWSKYVQPVAVEHQ